jgi:predicted NUDIX family NTP pyrophosphohydrolase
MASKLSAGLVLYRIRERRLEVLIAHMGGPFWAGKDDGAWSIVKGEYEQGDDPLAAARREFAEETGSPPPSGSTIELGEVRQSSGKRVVAWAVEGELDPAGISSNSFSIEWPRGSGRQEQFPEIDRVGWFDTATARRKLVKGQTALMDRLEQTLRAAGRVSA